MNTTLKNLNNDKRAKQYLIKEIMEATPQQLLLKTYDFAIMNCKKQNLIETNNALQTLINALRFDNDDVREVSAGLMKLYLFCQQKMRKKDYPVVLKVLTDLRQSWVQAFNNSKG